MPLSTFKLIEGASRNPNYQVYVVLPEPGEFSRQLNSLSVTVRIIKFKRLRISPVNLIKFAITFLESGLAFRRFLVSEKIELVHFSDIIDAPFYVWSFLASVKNIAHVRINFGGIPGRLLLRWWTSLFCSRVICISESIRSNYGFDSEKCRVIYNSGPDRNLFDKNKVTPLAHLQRGEKMGVLTIATFRSIKGLHLFLEIASIVEQLKPGKAHFIIAGGKVDGHENYYERVLESARRLSLEDKLTITGELPHSQIPSVLASSTVLVHSPVCQEGLGGVVLEAIAMGVPVVAFDSGGIRECFRDRISGFLIPQFDCRAAAEKVTELLENSDMRQTVSQAAFIDLDKRFTYKSNLSNVHSCYNEVLGAMGEQ